MVMQLPLPRSQPAGARIQCLREELRSIGGHGVGDNKMFDVQDDRCVFMQQNKDSTARISSRSSHRHVIVCRGSGNEGLAHA